MKRLGKLWAFLVTITAAIVWYDYEGRPADDDDLTDRLRESGL